MAKEFVVEVTIPQLPEGKKKWEAGDTFEVTVTAPSISRGAGRGQLSDIALEDMTDDQLKREIINANSVLYKATKRGAAEETIAANQARVDAAKAEKAKRVPVVTEEASAVAEAVEGSTEVDEETASEM